MSVQTHASHPLGRRQKTVFAISQALALTIFGQFSILSLLLVAYWARRRLKPALAVSRVSNKLLLCRFWLLGLSKFIGRSSNTVGK